MSALPTTPATRPVIIDCDPGHDDAMALLLAYAAPELDLLAVTTSAGNQTLDKCTLNAQRVLSLAGAHDVPLAAGASTPLARPLRIADDVHGLSGLDGYTFNSPTIEPLTEHAVTLMRELIRRSASPVTLIGTGALTNIAILLRDHPEACPNIEEIVWMGGSTGRGNVTPYAESNAYVDPEAAQLVFDHDIPTTMIGLNVTHQALVTSDIIDTVRTFNTPVGDAFAELMGYFTSTYGDIWNFEAPPLHDPVAVARVIDPAIVECVRTPVKIETDSDLTRGATVVDLDGVCDWPDNALVGLHLVRDRFWDRMIEGLNSYG